MSAPNEKPDAFPPGSAQAYAPPTAPQRSREPAADNLPKVQIRTDTPSAPAPPPAAPPAALPFAPQAMGAPAAAPSQPQAAPFAPQVMGAAGPAATPFAPQVMGPPSQPQAAPFAPQVMGPPSQPQAAPFAPQVMGAHAAPQAAPFAPQVMGGLQGGIVPGGMVPPPAPAGMIPGIVPGGMVPGGIVPQAAPPVPPATPSSPEIAAQAPPPMAPAPAASPSDDLAASPWNSANNPGFNRQLLPSAMVVTEPEPPPKQAAKVEPAEGPSRGPWIVVGALVLIAIAGAVAVVQLSRHHGGDGLAIPGGSAAPDDTPADSASAAPATSASAAAPVHRYAPKPKSVIDDPYADTPSTPSQPKPKPTSTAAPHRLFGTEN